MRIQISAGTADFVAAQGGELWIWAARPRRCCAGAPALMRVAVAPPAGLSGFTDLPASTGLRLHFRPFAGQYPDVLEIALTGRRRPRVTAYWDGCLMAMA
jgi:hypothetical protein